MANIENINPSKSFIIFDLETSRLGYKAEILQLSAVCREEEFNVYTKPLFGIDPHTSEVNKLSMNQNNELCYDGQVVNSVPLLNGLKQFFEWLENFPNPFLMGHNIEAFDCPVLFRALEKCNLKLEFCRLMCGFVDTKKFFRKRIPKNRVDDYQQRTLVMYYLKETYEEHNALADVKSLQKLLLHVNISEDELLKYAILPKYFSKRSSYKKMIDSKAITDGMARKFSLNNISYNDLLSHYRIGGKETLKKFLNQTKNKKVIGTNNAKVVNKICQYIESL